MVREVFGLLVIARVRRARGRTVWKRHAITQARFAVLDSGKPRTHPSRLKARKRSDRDARERMGKKWNGVNSPETQSANPNSKGLRR